LTPSEGVELGFLGFPRQSVDELLETTCADYDTIYISVLSLMYHDMVLPKAAEEGADPRTFAKAALAV
jgi:hypothetical protein